MNFTLSGIRPSRSEMTPGSNSVLVTRRYAYWRTFTMLRRLPSRFVAKPDTGVRGQGSVVSPEVVSGQSPRRLFARFGAGVSPTTTSVDCWWTLRWRMANLDDPYARCRSMYWGTCGRYVPINGHYFSRSFALSEIPPQYAVRSGASCVDAL